MWVVIDFRNIFFMICSIVGILLLMIPATYKYGSGKAKIVVMMFMVLIIVVSAVFNIPVGFFNEIVGRNMFIILGLAALGILSFISYSVSVKFLKECEC